MATKQEQHMGMAVMCFMDIMEGFANLVPFMVDPLPVTEYVTGLFQPLSSQFARWDINHATETLMQDRPDFWVNTQLYSHHIIYASYTELRSSWAIEYFDDSVYFEAWKLVEKIANQAQTAFILVDMADQNEYWPKEILDFILGLRDDLLRQYVQQNGLYLGPTHIETIYKNGGLLNLDSAFLKSE